MRDDISDQDFTQAALQRMPASRPSPDLERALLAAYDAWNAKRGEGRWRAFMAGARQFSDSIWPGAPLWAPATAFAFALLVGAGLGAALPSALMEVQPAFSLEQPASFNLLAPEGVQEGL